MTKKIYLYKLTVDDGGAPCVAAGILSLAICKPAIRSCAILLGFAANSLYKDNCLVYAAEVTEHIPDGKYFSQSTYAARPDCIYEWDGQRFKWKSYSRFHSPSDLAHDLGEAPRYQRANALLSTGEDKFRYFSAKCPVNYKEKYPRLKSLIEDLCQGARVNFKSELQKELRQFVAEVFAVKSAYHETMVPDTPHGDACSHADEDFVAVDC
jgi:hypothetical protein